MKYNSIISILKQEISNDSLTFEMLNKVKKHIEKILITDF